MPLVDKRIVALSVARLVDAIGNASFVVLLPAYLASDAVSLQVGFGGFSIAEGTLIGIGVSIYGFTNGSFQHYTGRLSDFFSRRKPFVLLGLTLLAGASFLFPLANGYFSVVTLRALQGVGTALALPASMAIVNEFADETVRGENIGLFNAVWLIGYGIGPILAGGVLSSGPYTVSMIGNGGPISGFTVAFAIAGLFVLLSILLITLFVPEPETTSETKQRESGSASGSDCSRFVHPVYALGVAVLLMSMTVDMFISLQPNINSHLGQDEAMFGVEYSILIVALVLLLVPVGYASDRIGRRPFLLAGFAILTPTVLVQGFVTSPISMLAARFGQGIAVAMIFSPGLAFAGDFAYDGNSGTWFGVITTAFGLGRAIGPLVSGILVDISYLLPFIVGSGCATIAFAITLLLVNKPPAASAEKYRTNSEMSS